MKRFEDYFLPIQDSCPVITIPKEIEDKIDQFVDRLIQSKRKEFIHIIDGGSEKKRWKTGISGEIAVEMLLGIEFVDWTIGESKNYNCSDLSACGLDVGIKTVEYGKFPIIHKNSKRPEIIVVKKGNLYYICGLAPTHVLNTHQDDNLVLSPKLRARNTKTGFYGFQYLIPFRTFKELESLTRKLAIVS